MVNLKMHTDRKEDYSATVEVTHTGSYLQIGE